MNELLGENTEPFKEPVYRALVSMIPQGILLADREGRICFVSEKTEKMFGYGNGEMLGLPIEIPIPEEFHPEHKKKGFQYGWPIEKGRRRLFGRRKDGGQVFMEIDLSPVETEKDSFVLVSILDIKGRPDDAAAGLQDNKFKLLADYSSEFIGMCDMSLKPFYANKAALQIVGIESMEQAHAMSVEDFFFPEDQQFILEDFFPRVMREGRAETEIRFCHFQTGEPLWMIYNVFLIKRDDGQPLGLGTVSRNITERKKIEEFIRQREQRYRLIFEGIKESFVVQEVVTNETGEICDLRYLEINPQAEKELGKNRTELIGHVRSEVLGPLDPETIQMVNRVVLKNEVIKMERYVAGINRWFEVSMYSPQPGQIATLNMDITDRKHQEWNLRQQEAELRVITDNVPALVARIGSDLRYRFVNRGFEQKFKKPREEIIGMHVWEIWGETVFEAIKRHINKVLAGESVDFEISVPEGAGDFRRMNFAYYPDRSEEGRVTGFYALIKDVTETRRVEKLERSNRELKYFAAVASHDLQAPLRKILSFSELLLAGSGDGLNAKGKEYVTRIMKNAERMIDFMKSMLQQSLLMSEPVLEKVSMNNVVSQVLFDLDSSIREAKAQLTVGDLPTVQSNHLNMYQILSNLISNALKFRGQAPLSICITAQRDGNEWVFSVSDNGRGIPKEKSQSIFEIFTRLHRYDEIPGSGIGLNTCKKIVEKMGGRIWVESEYGKGSTFYFTLPALQLKSS